MASKVAKTLLKMQKRWKTSEARARQEGIPDGQYQARIVSAGIDRSKSAGRLQTVLKFKIEAGKQKGRFQWKYDGLETPDNISWLKATLRTMEIKVPNKIVNLEKALEKLEDEMCVITIKTAGQFTNTYINKRIEDIDEGEEEDVDEDVEEEDVEEKPKKKKGKKGKKKSKKDKDEDEDEDTDDEDEGLEDNDKEDDDEDEDEDEDEDDEEE